MPTPDDNYARRTNHDYIGSFGRIPNEPKTRYTNILHCSVDRKMVLRAQELAPSGIMLVILSLNASIYKQSFQTFGT